VGGGPRVLVELEEVEIEVVVDVRELDVHLIPLQRRAQRGRILDEHARAGVDVQVRHAVAGADVVAVVQDHIEVAVVVEVREAGRARVEARREAARGALVVEETRSRAALVHVQVRRLGAERVGEERIDPAVAVDVAGRDALRVRDVDAEPGDALVDQRPGRALDQLVDEEQVLPLRSGTHEPVAVRHEDVEVAVVVDVGAFDALAPLRSARERRDRVELLGLCSESREDEGS
jgi:hypothetical protein